jgi:hypothetical protein
MCLSSSPPASSPAKLLGPNTAVVRAQGGKVYELRTYTAPEGKLTNLQARFRDHTIRIFNKTQHEERRLLGAARTRRIRRTR